MKILAGLKQKISEDKWFYGLMIFTVVILIAIRSFPYVLHGPFGFGYDTGIYKKTFEDLTTFSDIFESQIYILPAFLAYIFNILHLPLDFLLYHAYILFSILIAWPLYLLTKEFFGKLAGLIAVAIFTISYVQVFTSEYYFFKSMLGAVFLLFGFLYYIKKSNWFYLFAVLLLFTQLPQLLVLAVGTGISAMVNFKKDLRFNMKGIILIAVSIIILMIVVPHHLINAFNVVYHALTGSGGFDPHQSGSFIPLGEFLEREWFFFVLGLGGFIATIKRKDLFPLQITSAFLLIIVFFELFFERRYVILLSLFFIPYAGYFLAKCYEYFLEKYKIVAKRAAVLIFLAVMVGSTIYHYSTTYPAINTQEAWAIDIISKKTDSDFVMVTSSYYAPWLYGFSGKAVLAPGMFIKIWNLNAWLKYMEGSDVDRAYMLIKIANKYGKYYVMEGTRQKYVRPDKASSLVKMIYSVNGARIYEVSPSKASYESSPESSSEDL